MLLYSRSSVIGSHRYGGIWLGDNNASWGQLLANIQMMPSVQMCGFLYAGADLCGFSSDTTPDLALRWLEFGLLTPLMRNHSAIGTRMQEYYRFPEMLPAIRRMLHLRYALLPYLYSEFMKAALENGSYFRPLAFDYPAGHHYLRCALDEVLFFLRPGCSVPVAAPADNTAQLDDTQLTLWSYLPDGGSAAYRMYTDDGFTTDYDAPEHWRLIRS